MQVTDCAFSTSIHGLSAKNKGHELKWKKLGAVTYITDQENEVSKTELHAELSWKTHYEIKQPILNSYSSRTRRI